MEKRKDGRYRTSIVIGHDENGKQLRKYVYGSTRQEVMRKMAELRVKLSKKIDVNGKTLVE